MYASQVWYANLTTIEKLETFQNRILKWAFPTTSSNYKDRPIKGKLPISLYLQYLDVALLNKLFKENFDLGCYVFVKEAAENSRTKCIQLQRPVSNMKKTDQSFFSRVCRVANFIMKTYSIDIRYTDRKTLYNIFFSFFETDYYRFSCERFIKCSCCFVS